MSVQSQQAFQDELFDGQHSKMMASLKQIDLDLNAKYIQRLYQQLGEHASLAEKRDFFLEKLKTEMRVINAAQKSRAMLLWFLYISISSSLGDYKMTDEIILIIDSY